MNSSIELTSVKKILVIGIMVVLSLFLLGANSKAAQYEHLGNNVNSFLNGNKMYPCIYDNNGVQSYLDLSSLIWTKDISCPDGTVDHVVNGNIITMDDNKPIYHPVQLRINDNGKYVYQVFSFQPSGDYLLAKDSPLDPQFNAGAIVVNLIHYKELLKR